MSRTHEYKEMLKDLGIIEAFVNRGNDGMIASTNSRGIVLSSSNNNNFNPNRNVSRNVRKVRNSTNSKPLSPWPVVNPTAFTITPKGKGKGTTSGKDKAKTKQIKIKKMNKK